MSFKFVTSDNQSIIYAVIDGGDLLYYRDEARNGTARWSFGGTGQKIGNGWGVFYMCSLATVESSMPSLQMATS